MAKQLFGGLEPIKPLAPFGMTKRQRKPKEPRPEYSVDLEGERRKHKRVTIDELTQRGTEVLKERAPDLPKTDERSMFTKVLDVLDVPRNIIANAIAAAAGVDTSKMRKGTLLPKVWMSDILEKAGMPKGAVRSIVGFVGDLAIDPLTYIGLGSTTGVKVARHVPRVVGAGAQAIQTAAKTGKVGAEVASAIGRQTAEALSKQYAKIAAVRGAKVAAQQMRRALSKRLAGGATRGATEALEFFAKHGEKGRTLFRLPFASKGVGYVPFGKRARQYGAVVEDIADAGGRVARMKEVAATARKTAAAASAASRGLDEIGDALKTEQARVKELREGLDKLRKQRKIFRFAEATARKKGFPVAKGARPPVRTSELRKAERELNLAETRVADLQKRYDAAKAVGELKGKFEVAPEAEAVLKRAAARQAPPLESLRSAQRLRKAAREAKKQAAKAAPKVPELTPAQQRFETPVKLKQAEATAAIKRLKELKGAKQTAKADVAAKQAAAEEARNVRVALASSPEAPGVMRELAASKYGSRLYRKMPGVVNLFRKLKRDVAGPGASPVGQEVLGATQRATRTAAQEKAQAIADFARRIEPIAAKYGSTAPQGKAESTAEALRRLLFHLAELGPGQKLAPTLTRGDPLIRHFRYAQRSGLLKDPQVVSALDDYFGAVKRAHEIKAKAGAATGEVQSWVKAEMLPAGRERIGMTQAAGKFKPGIGQPTSGLEKGKWLIYQMPDGTQRKFMSTGSAREELAQAIAEGAEKVGEAPISRAQWNRWGRLSAVKPEATPKAFGAEIKGGPSLREGIFRESLPHAAGMQAKAAEQAQSMAELRELIKPYSATIGRKDPRAATAEFAHMAFPTKRPSSGSPMAQLAAEGLFDRLYPVEIADMIDGATKMWESPEGIEKILSVSDRLLSVWKSLTLMHPAYVLRNIIEKPIGVILAGGDPIAATRWAFSKESRLFRRALVDNSPELVAGRLFNFGGRAYRGEDLFDLARRFHAIGAGRTATEMPAQFGARLAEQVAAKYGPKAKGLYQSVHRSNTAFEDWQKLGAWFSFMDAGESPREAFMRTLIAQPDMADLPVWTQRNLTRIFPWARWRIKNGARMLGTVLPEKPQFFSMIQRFPNLLEGITTQDSVPNELRPAWMQDALYAQVMGNKEGGLAFGLQSWLPVQEALTVMGAPLAPGEAARQAIGEIRPGAKALVEGATGQSIFRQEPLQTVEQAGGLAQAIPQALLGQSGTALDSLLAVRPLREYAPMVGRVAAMPTTGRQVARGLVGGALQPVDYQKGLTGRYYELNNLQQQLRAAHQRALQSGDQARADALFNQWLAVVRQMYQWKLPLPKAAEQMFAGAGTARPGPP